MLQGSDVDLVNLGKFSPNAQMNPVAIIDAMLAKLELVTLGKQAKGNIAQNSVNNYSDSMSFFGYNNKTVDPSFGCNK